MEAHAYRPIDTACMCMRPVTFIVQVHILLAYSRYTLISKDTDM